MGFCLDSKLRTYAVAVTLLFVAFMASGWPYDGDPVVEGNFVVVRGALTGCELSAPIYIFDVVEVENADPITLMGIPDIDVIGQSAYQIELQLADRVEQRTGRKPATLEIDILLSEQEYRAILKEYLHSLQMISVMKCYPVRGEPGPVDPHDIDEQMENFRLMELVDSLA